MSGFRGVAIAEIPPRQNVQRGTGPYGLTSRELQILQMVCDGGSDKTIACALGIAVNTVSNHRAGIYKKSGTHGGARLGVWAVRNGLLTQ